MRLINFMKPMHARKILAPTPRLTLWVQVLVSLFFSAFWLGLLALANL